jgi:hypothetical protein
MGQAEMRILLNGCQIGTKYHNIHRRQMGRAKPLPHGTYMYPAGLSITVAWRMVGERWEQFFSGASHYFPRCAEGTTLKDVYGDRDQA